MDEVAAILLTGGSSRIPRVAQLLSERFDRPIAIDADPKAIIALGAARTAADEPSQRRSTRAPPKMSASPRPRRRTLPRAKRSASVVGRPPGPRKAGRKWFGLGRGGSTDRRRTDARCGHRRLCRLPARGRASRRRRIRSRARHDSRPARRNRPPHGSRFPRRNRRPRPNRLPRPPPPRHRSRASLDHPPAARGWRPTRPRSSIRRRAASLHPTTSRSVMPCRCCSRSTPRPSPPPHRAPRRC